MSKLKITLEDAKATLRDAATGPDSQNWRYSPAVKALLNSHDELLVALGEMKHRAEAAEQRLQPIIPTLGSLEVNKAAWKLHDMLTEHGQLNGHRFNNLKGCFYEALKVSMGPNLTLQPALSDDYFGLLVRKARASADKAMRKYPQPNYVLNKVAEESGEVIKAVIHYTEGREEWVNVEGEIIDNLAMLIRLVTEGDQVIGFTPPEACHTSCEPHKLTGIQQSDQLKRALKLAGEAKELADRIRAEEQTPPAVLGEQLINIANHIAGSEGGLPDEWKDWANELVSDLRRLAASKSAPILPGDAEFKAWVHSDYNREVTLSCPVNLDIARSAWNAYRDVLTTTPKAD
ncbi:hypothetical protein [Serratia sp. JSRIV006]|uniref:hypothetical protein n=1 Tax=Serratia sp. JSRIV006 TaxID=2831896 RepID=UPI001CC03F9C|nr:hypothetical protein [Serratia sp. JSRIV006]